MTGDIKTHVQRQFGNAAAQYAVSAVHARGIDLGVMVECARLSGGERVLDAGCGAGHTALSFAPHVREVMALDLTAAMIEQVRRLAAERGLTNVAGCRGDVERLPFPAGAFDVVASRYSAHHWPDPRAALRQFARVLKPDGQFLLADVVAPDNPTQDTFLQAVELLRDPSHVRDHSEDQWLAVLEQAGFAPEVVFTWDIYLDFDDWIARMATPQANAAMIKTLFDGAPAEVRAAMDVQPDYSFMLRCALLRGTLRG